MKRIPVMMILIGLLVAGCASSEEGAWKPKPQQWQDLTVEVETRPEMPRIGMNEFIIIINRASRGYISDLIVDVRTEHSEWRQAMPDGALGVYRRALPVRSLDRDHLYVRLIRHNGKQQGELTFALGNTGEAGG